MMEKILDSGIHDMAAMAFEKHRLRTFKTWPFNNSCNCSTKNMAEAGFYLIASEDSEADAVECFYCGKQLDGWEDSDDPWKEHYKHASYCDFAKLKKPEIQLTVEEFLNLYHNALKNRINKIIDAKIVEAQNHHQDVLKKYKRDYKKIKN
ncbi:baculoviral IAP repeat-containing protein 5-like [Chrysoperla carnea]|uniref:baculoviral IAP repeat-containing protein 5-like n=1 Tax=Chrysoperla carnea TaxID=189513 RepID=UPI001D087D8B|nr:baculoviral IAP repeat-containing protein 5-like [Chrysoperla carnea]